MDVLALFADRKFYEGEGRRSAKRSPFDGRKPKRRKAAKRSKRATYVESRPKYSAWMHAFPGCHPELE